MRMNVIGKKFGSLEAFLHNIKAFHDHYYSLESATQSFKEIINKRP